jgi:hypothetical protein
MLLKNSAIRRLELLFRFGFGPHSAFRRTTSTRLIVTCRSLATRRTSAANVAGNVTLCRMNLADAALLFVAIPLECRWCTSLVRIGF